MRLQASIQQFFGAGASHDRKHSGTRRTAAEIELLGRAYAETTRLSNPE
jgi:hypothetical protein